MFVDEAGFYLLPMEVAHLRSGWTDTSAPSSVDPRSSDHAIGGITPGGRIYLHMQESASSC